MLTHIFVSSILFCSGQAWEAGIPWTDRPGRTQGQPKLEAWTTGTVLSLSEHFPHTFFYDNVSSLCVN